jgi:hypothetical protein
MNYGKIILAAYMGHTDYSYTIKYLKVLDAEHRNNWVDFCVFNKKIVIKKIFLYNGNDRIKREMRG